MQTPEAPQLLELEEAAELLRTTPRTLRRWTSEGRVPKVQGLGRKLLYNRAELLKLGTPQGNA